MTTKTCPAWGYGEGGECPPKGLGQNKSQGTLPSALLKNRFHRHIHQCLCKRGSHRCLPSLCNCFYSLLKIWEIKEVVMVGCIEGWNKLNRMTQQMLRHSGVAQQGALSLRLHLIGFPSKDVQEPSLLVLQTHTRCVWTSWASLSSVGVPIPLPLVLWGPPALPVSSQRMGPGV